jgi:hypothetical protein
MTIFHVIKFGDLTLESIQLMDDNMFCRIWNKFVETYGGGPLLKETLERDGIINGKINGRRHYHNSLAEWMINPTVDPSKPSVDLRYQVAHTILLEWEE